MGEKSQALLIHISRGMNAQIRSILLNQIRRKKVTLPPLGLIHSLFAQGNYSIILLEIILLMSVISACNLHFFLSLFFNRQNLSSVRPQPLKH